MGYSLEKDGDLYEIKYWKLVKTDFPNYEVFWSQFVIPLTNRIEGQGIGLKKGTHQLLESVVMAHYTIFYHLGAAADLQSRLAREYSEDVLFHLSSATEMVERFIFDLAKLISHFQGVDVASALADADVCAITEGYLSSKQYSKEFERFLQRGQSVNIRIYNSSEIVRQFMHGLSEIAEKDFESWQNTANQIRHYRNTFAHNPKIGALLSIDGQIYVPKESELNKYGLWSAIVDRIDNRDFILLSELLTDFQSKLFFKTNRLWEHLIEFMNETVKSEKYTQLVGEKFTTVLVNDVKPSEALFVSASGTFSRDPTISDID